MQFTDRADSPRPRLFHLQELLFGTVWTWFPALLQKVQCCWSWLRVTGTCEFDCDPLCHCHLLCLYRETSSQQISGDAKRQAALWRSHGFKGNWCLGHVVCCGVLADTKHMHPVNCSLIAPLQEQFALKIKTLREFSFSGYPNCDLRATWDLLRSIGTSALISTGTSIWLATNNWQFWFAKWELEADQCPWGVGRGRWLGKEYAGERLPC